MDYPSKIVARHGKVSATYFKRSRRVMIVADDAAFDDIDIAVKRLKNEIADR
ncbi:hypothetical protein ACXYX3_17545 [Mycobacterium sp. C3-094]